MPALFVMITVWAAGLFYATSVATKPRLTTKEIEFNCILAIMQIESDVGRWDRELICDIAKDVTLGFEGFTETVDCSRICRANSPEVL